MNNLKLEGKTVVLDVNLNENAMYAAANLPSTEYREVSQVSVYELLKFNHVVLTQDAVKYYEEVLG